jgi:hypothetical protein
VTDQCFIEGCRGVPTTSFKGSNKGVTRDYGLCDRHAGSLSAQLAESGHGLDTRGHLVKVHPFARPGDRRFVAHD